MQAQITTPTFGDDRLPARFWAKVRLGSVPAHRPDLGPCWEWTGFIDPQFPYGRFRVGPRFLQAHRVSFEALAGTIPTGLTLDHLCRVTPCVRPSHLEP